MVATTRIPLTPLAIHGGRGNFPHSRRRGSQFRDWYRDSWFDTLLALIVVHRKLEQRINIQGWLAPDVGIAIDAVFRKSKRLRPGFLLKHDRIGVHAGRPLTRDDDGNCTHNNHSPQPLPRRRGNLHSLLPFLQLLQLERIQRMSHLAGKTFQALSKTFSDITLEPVSTLGSRWALLYRDCSNSIFTSDMHLGTVLSHEVSCAQSHHLSEKSALESDSGCHSSDYPWEPGYLEMTGHFLTYTRS